MVAQMRLILCPSLAERISHANLSKRKTSPLGAVGGAIAAIIVGFAWGGWVTGGTAEKMAVTQSGIAVVEALVPVCVAVSVSDPAGPAKLEQLAALKSSYERTDFVMKSGWATMPTAKEPNRRVAEARS